MVAGGIHEDAAAGVRETRPAFWSPSLRNGETRNQLVRRLWDVSMLRVVDSVRKRVACWPFHNAKTGRVVAFGRRSAAKERALG